MGLRVRFGHCGCEETAANRAPSVKRTSNHPIQVSRKRVRAAVAVLVVALILVALIYWLWPVPGLVVFFTLLGPWPRAPWLRRNDEFHGWGF